MIRHRSGLRAFPSLPVVVQYLFSIGTVKGFRPLARFLASVHQFILSFFRGQATGPCCTGGGTHRNQTVADARITETRQRTKLRVYF